MNKAKIRRITAIALGILCFGTTATYSRVVRGKIEWITLSGTTPDKPFNMGSNNSDGSTAEWPVHSVNVKSFEMSKTEVTVEQYKACVDAGKCTRPNEGTYCNWEENGPKPGRENHPINCVSWHQALNFAQWVGARLPSEAEWEYAAKSGGKNQEYSWGNDKATCERAVMRCDYDSAQPVCSKPFGNSEQGLCDMAGNVFEWVADTWHNSYDGAPSDGSAWVDTGPYRIFRGGHWGSNGYGVRSSYRAGDFADQRPEGVGFRVVRSSH